MVVLLGFMFPCLAAKAAFTENNQAVVLSLGETVTHYPVPNFSQDHGLYNRSFSLKITCSSPETAIYYTTDGSVPSAVNGTLYQDGVNITGTTVVRAVAVKGSSVQNGLADSPATTRTYLFVNDILKQSNTPAGYPATWGPYATISGTAIADYEMDAELLKEAGFAAHVRACFNELPVVSVVTDKKNLFNQVEDSLTGGIYIYTGPPTGGAGNGWERPASFEYFFERDTISLQADCGLQLHGGHSRLPEKCPKHSFRIDFQSEYGPSKLDYPLFGKSEAQQINSFILRAGFGNTWLHQTALERSRGIYTRDAWAKRTQKRMGQLSANTQYAHLFLNGLYWGLYNPTERIDDDFCATYLGGKKSEYDVIKVEDTKQAIIASDGTLAAWNKLISTVAGAADPAVYQRLQGKNADGTTNTAYECLLDVDNFIDYMLINQYGSNTDWDHHNWIALRNRVYPGKGFRFLCWDSERIMETVDGNVLSENNKSCPSYLFQQLKKNALFCRRYADRVQKHCFNHGSLSPEGATETWKGLADVIDDALYAESARWGDYRRDVHRYQTAGELYRKDVQYDALRKDMLETYFPNRTATFITQLRSAGLFPRVDAPAILINDQEAVSDTIADHDIVSLSASGLIYYTLNGTDPVSWSKDGTGEPTVSAIRYTTGWEPENPVHVMTRTFCDSSWSALNERIFYVNISADGLSKIDRAWSAITVRNDPNPFTGQTTFSYTMPKAGHICLTVFDLSGREVAAVVNENQQAGHHSIVFDGSALKPSIYVCRFTVTGAVNRQLVLKISKL